MSKNERQLPQTLEIQAKKEVQDAGCWNVRKDEVLVASGFPRHALSETKIITGFEFERDEAGNPRMYLAYGKDGKFKDVELKDMFRCEPFKNEEEFKAVCEKIAGYYKEYQEVHIKALDYHISKLRDQIKEAIGGEWTHKPQVRPGTYMFENGKGRAAPGARETLSREEIEILQVGLLKRLQEQKLLPENLEKEAVGLSSPQIFEADDGRIIHIIDQLDHAGKQRGDFREEDDYWTIAAAGER